MSPPRVCLPALGKTRGSSRLPQRRLQAWSLLEAVIPAEVASSSRAGERLLELLEPTPIETFSFLVSCRRGEKVRDNIGARVRGLPLKFGGSPHARQCFFKGHDLRSKVVPLGC